MDHKIWISLIEIQHVINVLERDPKDIDVRFFSSFILEQVLNRLIQVYCEMEAS
jgi:alkylation response protein AidB-like acyl-CoA dehydrogenase